MKAKTIQSLLLLIGAIQCLFIGAIIFEHSQRLEVWIFVLLFGLLIASLLQNHKKPTPLEFESWKVSIWVFFGAFGTLGLRELGLGIVMAAAVVGLFGGLISMFNKSSKYWQQVATALYCGAFIGMSNVNVDPVFILLASVITAGLFTMSKSLLLGIGGKLGTLAFLGVVLAYGILISVAWIS